MVIIQTENKTKTKNMKKLILVLLGITITSCKQKTKLEDLLPKIPPPVEKSMSNLSPKDEYLMREVSFGLHKIQINDSTTVLLYRGTESCTMIQLK